MAVELKRPVAGALCCAAALLVLAVLVFGLGAVQRLDADAMGRLMTPTGEQAGPAVNAMAHFGGPLFVLLAAVAACAIALRRRRPFDALAVVVLVAGANLTTQAIKTVLSEHRIQPVFVNHEMLPAGIFPSGHATGAASIALAFLLVTPRSWRAPVVALALAFVLAVDVSVLILAWHYPSDVIAATLVACGWGLVALAVRRALEARSARPAADLPAAQG